MDTRTILLAEDGRHVTLGRYTGPDEAEIATITAKLAETGQGGWLATMSGSYYSKRGKLRVEALRQIGKPTKLYTEALVEFCRIRKGATQ